MPKAVSRSLSHAVLMLYVAFILFPIVFVVFSSLKETNADIVAHPFGLPVQLAFDNYAEAWKKAKINVYFFNSAYLSVTAAVSAVLLAAATSYALARMRFARASRWLPENTSALVVRSRTP